MRRSPLSHASRRVGLWGNITMPLRIYPSVTTLRWKSCSSAASTQAATLCAGVTLMRSEITFAPIRKPLTNPPVGHNRVFAQDRCQILSAANQQRTSTDSLNRRADVACDLVTELLPRNILEILGQATTCPKRPSAYGFQRRPKRLELEKQ